jgi:hypothetical protein
MQYIKKFFLLISFITSFTLQSQDNAEWRKAAEEGFFKLLKTKSDSEVSKIRVQLWTVTPGITVTTTFGHSALRIFNGQTEKDSDYYMDFGVYDESPAFFWRFLKGEALFYGNIVPTNSAYQNWDGSGRGVLSTELKLDNSQKKKLFQQIEKTYIEATKGYYYENFTNNCVTYLREIISKGLEKELALTKIDEGKNTWRARVLPYSTTIFWLNIEESLLFDHDTDKIRSPKELIFLPDDLYRSIAESDISFEDKIILKDRWGDRSGKGGLLWRIIFVAILIFSLPIAILVPFERISQILFGLVSGFGGLFASLVLFVTSFSFMNESIAWLVVSPIDFMFLANSESFKTKKYFRILILIRLLMIFIAFILRFTIYKQEIGNLLFLVISFYALFLFKNKTILFPKKINL